MKKVPYRPMVKPGKRKKVRGLSSLTKSVFYTMFPQVTFSQSSDRL